MSLLLRPGVRFPRFKHGVHSLRGQLTLANVGLLALGIVVATAVSLMGMRHYLLDQVDTQLAKTRESLGVSQLTMSQIDSLSALAFVRARSGPARTRGRSASRSGSW